MHKIVQFTLGLVLFGIGPFFCSAQPTTISILGQLDANAVSLDSLLQERDSYVIVHGNLSKDGILSHRLSSLNLSKERRNRLFISDGSAEWDYGASTGYQTIRSLDDQLDNTLKRDFVIGKGCAGPVRHKLDSGNVLVFLSSSFLLHRHYKPQFTTTDCDYIYPQDIYAELADILEKDSDKQVFLITYHSPAPKRPRSISEMLMPYHGASHLTHSSTYLAYQKHMQDIMSAYPGTIIISANDPSPSYMLKDEQHYCNANLGSNKILQAVIYDDHIDIVSARPGDRLVEKTILRSQVAPSAEDNGPSWSMESTATQPVGPQYGAGWLQRLLLGDNYRDEWTTPVQLPVLDLDTELGGLTPYKLGGGNQTQSLRFKTSDGRKYNFRSVNKDARRNTENVALQSIFGGVKQDQISSQLPFGDVFAGQILDRTDILHVTPQAFVMGDQLALGPYRSSFAGVVGTLEERPAGREDLGDNAFANADEIFSTHDVYSLLLEDGDHTVDGLSWAKAVLFSVWIADWDRHQDNFKWAGFKDKGAYTFRPIPRDRDHVLAVWEGLIGNAGDKLAPNVAELSPTIRDIPGLTNQGRALHHVMTNYVTREDWQDAASYLTEVIDAEVIQSAWLHIPKEIRGYHGAWVEERLLSRLAGLEEAAEDIYNHLNSRLDIYATNKDDYLQVRKEDGKLLIELYEEKNGKKAKDRHRKHIIDPQVTTEANIYLLDGDDIIDVDIEGGLDDQLRIILGAGTDRVEQCSDIRGLALYDSDDIADNRVHLLDREIHPSVYDFNYDALLATPYVLFDGDFGAGAEVLLTKYVQSWNRRPYGTRHRWAIRYYPQNTSIRLGYKMLKRNVWRSWHRDIYVRAAFRDTRVDNFSGINTEAPIDFADNRQLNGKYYVENSGIDLRYGIRRELFGKSDYRAHLGMHYLHIFDSSASATELQSDNVQVYHRSALRLDFTDRTTYPTGGQLYHIEGRVGYTATDDTGMYYLMDASVLKVVSWHDISRTILLAKVGAEVADGELRFYNYPSVGNGSHLRGTFNDIQRSDVLYYLNTEIRKEIYHSSNTILPFVLGLSAHVDYVDQRSWTSEDDIGSAYGYGGGLYATFLDHQYSIYLTYSDTSLETGAIAELGIGFRLR